MAEDDLSQLKKVVQQAVETIKQVNGDRIKRAIHVKPDEHDPTPPQEEAPVRRKLMLRKKRK